MSFTQGANSKKRDAPNLEKYFKKRDNAGSQEDLCPSKEPSSLQAGQTKRAIIQIFASA